MSAGIVIADDHPIYLSGLHALIEAEADLTVTAAVPSGEAAVDAVERMRPRLLITDIAMAGLGGIEAARQVNAIAPAVRILILTMHAERRYVLAALDAGANGYLLKDTAREELLQAIRLLLDGHTYLSPLIAGYVVDACREREVAALNGLDRLTPREREVLCLIATGSSTGAVAGRLGVSPKTIATHREHLMGKLNVHSNAELARYAVRNGLIPDD